MVSVKRKIKVLVVDDSLIFRETLARGLASDPTIEVVATAADPYSARDKILEYEPDVMTLDVEMPRMNGIEFLRRLIPQYPIPVVVVSAVSSNVFDALANGAVDFVTKPDRSKLESFFSELIVKIKIAATAKVSAPGKLSNVTKAAQSIGSARKCIIAIGASTGGTEAIETLIKTFAPDMPGTLVVQHMPPIFTEIYANRLNNNCMVEVREAKTGDVVVPGRVLIAPGDRHMRIKRVDGQYVVECMPGEKVSGHCPSVDVLFHSVAAQAGQNAIGVILTGMGADGASGLLAMRRAGARTIGQDEASSVVYGMPKAAWDIGAVQEQAALGHIHKKLFTWIINRQ